jgi:hypothetical protein
VLPAVFLVAGDVRTGSDLPLTQTSQNAKILYADRQPKGNQRSDRQAQRMGCILKRVVQDSEERRLEELC